MMTPDKGDKILLQAGFYLPAHPPTAPVPFAIFAIAFSEDFSKVLILNASAF